LKKFITDNKIFLILYLLFFIAGAAIIALFEKGDEIIYFSSLHSPAFNRIFIWLTHLGELPTGILILLFISFSSFGRGALFSVNLTLVFVVVQILKKLVFASQVRPALFFQGKQALNFVPGVQVLQHHSFPSGHSAGAFAIFFMLSILIKDKRWGFLFFALALLTAISRVYLLQHFFRDVYVGATLAVVITTVFWLTLAQSKLYNNLSWKDQSLYHITPTFFKGRK
jgi:membrane-associated phospholipid phosphatase